MAVVWNVTEERLSLTRGYIEPGEQLNIDTSGQAEQQLIGAGALVVVDASADPPAAPAVARAPVFVGEGTPVSNGAYLWVQTNSDGDLVDVLYQEAS